VANTPCYDCSVKFYEKETQKSASAGRTHVTEIQSPKGRFFYCLNRQEVGAMSRPRCRHYSPKEVGRKENCANCARQIGIQCQDHHALLKEYETSEKFRAYDRMMRDNKGIRFE